MVLRWYEVGILGCGGCFPQILHLNTSKPLGKWSVAADPLTLRRRRERKFFRCGYCEGIHVTCGPGLLSAHKGFLGLAWLSSDVRPGLCLCRVECALRVPLSVAAALTVEMQPAWSTAGCGAGGFLFRRDGRPSSKPSATDTAGLTGGSSLYLGNYRDADQELRRQCGDVTLRKVRYFDEGSAI